MHEKYTTRGLVVSSSAFREADKIISIYTEDFGLVSAAAAGVRRSASKLRYHTQDYSLRRFSLVRGRDIWRIVGAEEIDAVVPIKSSEHLASFARVLSLIRRLVRGEEKNERVFLNLLNLHEILASAFDDEIMQDDKNQSAYIAALETLAVFRILHSLGYIKADETTEPLITSPLIDRQLVESAKPYISAMINAINAGLTESHL